MRIDRWLISVMIILLVISAITFAVKSRRRQNGGAADVPFDPGSLSVLVIGIEGLDLETFERLSAEGRLPNLSALAAGGTLAEFETLGRSVDARIAWTSLVTGVSPENQGIGGTRMSLRGKRVQSPLTSKSRTVGTLWTALSEAGTPVGVLGWWGTWPVEKLDGVVVAPYTTYYLERKKDGNPETLVSPLEMLTRIDPHVLWPESYSRMDLARFVNTGEWLGMEALIGKGYEDLAMAYAGDNSMTRVARLLTIDPGVEAEFVLLTGIETVCQIFWLKAHTEDVDWDYLSESTRRILIGQIPALKDVIDLYYEFVDERVGELLELAADDATIAVVSSHGYDRLRYGSNRQPLLGNEMHDETGFWIMSGPRVSRGLRVEGLDMLDFAPTFAAAAGIELDDKVEGEVSEEAIAPD